jgi:GTP cyclohydrolase IA
LTEAYRYVLELPSIAKAIGPDHIKKTPLRVVKALQELLSGYQVDVAETLTTSFEIGKYNQMITVQDIKFTSLCAHHMLPFFGRMHFAYIPDGKIVGLSKIPRMIDALSRRLQVQETLGEEIVTTFQNIVKPKGCALMIESTHMCMSIRGVRKEGALMRTTALRGIFEKDASAKAEFLSGVNRK